jgi:hypothetical protein
MAIFEIPDDLPDAWEDLLEGLVLLAREQNSKISPFNCAHDTLYVGSDVNGFNESEIARLDKLGFFPDEEFGEGFMSYRFGSA